MERRYWKRLVWKMMPSEWEHVQQWNKTPITYCVGLMVGFRAFVFIRSPHECTDSNKVLWIIFNRFRFAEKSIFPFVCLCCEYGWVDIYHVLLSVVGSKIKEMANEKGDFLLQKNQRWKWISAVWCEKKPFDIVGRPASNHCYQAVILFPSFFSFLFYLLIYLFICNTQSIRT